MDANSLIPFFIVGGIGLLSFLKLANTAGVNRRANSSFGIFLLLFSSFWLDEMLFLSYLEEKGVFFCVIRLIQLFTPITFYLSIVFYTNPNYSFRIKDLYLLIAPLFFLILIVFNSLITKNIIDLLIISISPIHALFCVLLSYFRIVKHQKNIELFFSNKELINLNWIKYIIYSSFVSTLLIVFYTIFAPSESLNVYINFFFLGLVYFMGYYSTVQKEIFPKGYKLNDNTEAIKPSSQTNSNITKSKLMNDSELELYKNKLLKLMKDEQIFLDSELNLMKLADLLSISGHQLSYVINNGFNENFFYFINKYRVRKAEELLMNPDFDKFTILAIGFESGFNSKTAFNATFKKITTYTPSQYRKIRSGL